MRGSAAAARSCSVARERHSVEEEGGCAGEMPGMQKLGLPQGGGSRKGHTVPFPRKSSWGAFSICPSSFLCSLFSSLKQVGRAETQSLARDPEALVSPCWAHEFCPPPTRVPGGKSYLDKDGIPSPRGQFSSFGYTGGGSWDVLGSGRSGSEGQSVQRTGRSVSLETLHALIDEISESSQCMKSVNLQFYYTHVGLDEHTLDCVYTCAYCLFPGSCRFVTLTWSPEPGMSFAFCYRGCLPTRLCSPPRHKSLKFPAPHPANGAAQG